MFNPWEIVSWIGATAVSVIIVALTISMVVALIKPRKPGTTRIYRGQ